MPNDTLVVGQPETRRLTDRFLSLFTEVQNGEGIGALLLGAYVYLLLEAYYILKTVREALILSEGGAELKAYSSAAQAASPSSKQSTNSQPSGPSPCNE